jgi:hypothetical protein
MPCQVSAGEGQANTAFIAALSDRITSFAQQLNSIKQQQRSEYAALLQEEQQLFEELSVLELTLSDEQQQHESQEQAAWDASCSRVSTQHEPSAHTDPAGSRRGSDSAADCVHRSPDRPARQTGSTSSSPVKGLACAGGTDSSGLPPEVQAYDLFLARHGETGGWHADDHKTFIALLKAHRYPTCVVCCFHISLDMPWRGDCAGQLHLAAPLGMQCSGLNRAPIGLQQYSGT